MGILEEAVIMECTEILLKENKRLKIENKYLRSELNLLLKKYGRFL